MNYPQSSSPISALTAAEQGLQWAEVRSNGDWLCWLEFDPEEGCVRLRGRQGGLPSRRLTPENYSVRSRVHEYGGGAYCLTPEGVIFVNEADQGLYQFSFDQPRKIQCLCLIDGCRYGDLVYDSTYQRVLAVEEDHGQEGVADNRLVAIHCDGGKRELIAERADFYSSPRISRSGHWMAWISWDHPYQPWLSTRLTLSKLGTNGLPVELKEVTTGHYSGHEESIVQPEFGPDESLFFISDRSGWWNLYQYTEGKIRSLLTMEAEFGVAQWQLGLRSYCLLSANKIVCSLIEKGQTRLGVLALNGELALNNDTFQPLDGVWARCHGLNCWQGQVHFIAETALESAKLMAMDQYKNRLNTLEYLQPADGCSQESGLRATLLKEGVVKGHLSPFLLRLQKETSHMAFTIKLRGAVCIQGKAQGHHPC